MKKLNTLRNLIEQGQFPNEFPEFGGANLIITKDHGYTYYDHDVVVYSEHASALSWLVVELKTIYDSEIDYLNKYDFYPSIGILINKTLIRQELLFETMLYIVDEIEKQWGNQ